MIVAPTRHSCVDGVMRVSVVEIFHSLGWFVRFMSNVFQHHDRDYLTLSFIWDWPGAFRKPLKYARLGTAI